MKKAKVIHITVYSFVYALLSIWVFASVLHNSMLVNIEQVSNMLGKCELLIRLLLVVVALVSLAKKKVERKKIIVLLCFLLIVVIEYKSTRTWLLFELFFVEFFFGEHLDYQKVVKSFLYSSIAGFFVVFALFCAGVLPSYVFLTSRAGGRRVMLGFNHPLFLGDCIMVIIFAGFLLMYENNKLRYAIVMLLGAIWVAIFPNALTVAICIILALVLRVVLEMLLGNAEERMLRVFFIVLFISFAVFTSILYYMIFHKNLDNIALFHRIETKTLFSRITLGRVAIQRYGISLFGTIYESATEMQVIMHRASEYFVIDCVYFLLPIRYGMIVTTAFVFAYFRLLYVAIMKKNFDVIALLIDLLVLSISVSFITLFMISFVFICAKCNKSINNLDYPRFFQKKRRLVLRW